MTLIQQVLTFLDNAAYFVAPARLTSHFTMLYCSPRAWHWLPTLVSTYSMLNRQQNAVPHCASTLERPCHTGKYGEEGANSKTPSFDQIYHIIMILFLHMKVWVDLGENQHLLIKSDPIFEYHIRVFPTLKR